MIEARVADGLWSVMIPTRRVVLSGITAYGWFESEVTTGRIVGRTEDGLHGSITDPHNWPAYERLGDAGRLPIAAWVEGITAYTAGGVTTAMRWHKQPGFESATPEAFKRFVEMGALDFAAGWWNEVGSEAFGDHQAEYWAGVCLNHHMQSLSFGTPSEACARRWAESICERIAADIASAPIDSTAEDLKEMIEERYGEEMSDLIAWAADKTFGDIVSTVKEMMENAFKRGFDCGRLRGK